MDVQGQKFCLACGLLLPASAIMGSPPILNAKKRSVGRPKTPRLDIPLSPDQAESATAVADPLSNAKGFRLEQHDVPDIAAAGKHIDLIRRSRSDATVKDLTRESIPSVEAQQKANFKLNYPHSGWLEQLKSKASYRFGLPAAIWFATLASAGVYGYRLIPWRGLSPSKPQLAIAIAVILSVWTAAIIASWGQAAIIYGRTRRADHRKLPIKAWSAPAFAASGESALLNAGVVVGVVVLGAGSLGLMNLVKVASSAPIWAVIAALFSGYIVLVYLLLALLMLRRLAVTMVVVAGTKQRPALNQAMIWLKAYPELITLELYEAMIWLLGWALLMPIGYYLLHQSTIVGLSGTFAAMLIVAMIQQLRAAGWQQALYYQLATTFEGNQRAIMLGGRQPKSH